MRRSGKLALGGMLCALSCVVMLLSGLSVGVYALPMVAGALLVPMAIECGTKWGLCCYAVVSLLCIFIVPSAEARLLFWLFFGYFPVVKNAIDCLRAVWLRWVIKFAVFNAAMIAVYLLMFFVFALPADTFVIFGVSLPWLYLLVGNGALILYDYALNAFGTLYLRKLRPWLTRFLH